MTYSLVGVKFEIGEIIWLGGNIRHSFTPDSFTTSLELESQLPEGDVSELADKTTTKESYTGLVAWYRDPKTGQQHKLTEGDQTKPRRLTHLYESKASAKRALEREWKRMQEKQKAP
ncbi:phage late control protein GPD [compost metagenome]